MKTSYTILMPSGIRPAIADVSELGTGLYEINRINVPQEHRGKGYGTKILQQILDDADKEQVKLVLSVFSSDMRGIMKNDELIAWYMRHGFKMVSYVHHLMERPIGGRVPKFEDLYEQRHSHIDGHLLPEVC